MAIITISRQLGSLGNEIAHELAEELKYNLLSKEMISNMLSESGFSEKKSIETFSAEKKPSFLNSFMLDRDRFIHYIEKVLYEFARQENVIIVGMGGQSLFQVFPNTLRIRVIAPLDVRIKRTKEKHACSDHYAEHLVRESDQIRSNFNKYFFDTDWQATELYDLIINTNTVALERAVGLIKDEIQEIEKQRQQEEMIRKLEELVLKQKVLIRIMYEEKISLPHLTLDIQENIVTLSGWSRSIKDREDCETVVREIPGVKEVVNKILSSQLRTL